MRISLVNLNLIGADAIGQCLLNQTRYSLRRGDQIQLYTQHPPYQVPDDLAALAHVVNPAELEACRDDHFARSDLYVYHYPAYYPLIDSIKYIDRGAVIFYFHNVTPPNLWGSAFERDTLTKSLVRVTSLAALADLCVTDSEFNADCLVYDHGVDRERIRVLPLAVPLDQFAPGPKNEALLRKHNLHGKRVIEFVGRMAGNKRIDLLIEALPLVRQHVPNVVLLLVGDDSSNPAIAETVSRATARAEELGVTPQVIFTGVVDDQAPYYRLADVYATASLHEGFGVPLIEAMASGVPVVASNATAHPWVLGQAGLLAEPKSTEDLARQIVRILSDDALHGELVQYGLARAREFSLERYENDWGRIVAEATTWLPEQPYPRLQTLEATVKSAANATLKDLRWLDNAADVMQRDYMVRSNAPLVGSLIAWVRRNLTSHLREPYVDPTFERQVAFNREVVRSIHEQNERLATLAKAWQMVEQQREAQRQEVQQIKDQLLVILEELIQLNADNAAAARRLRDLWQRNQAFLSQESQSEASAND